MSHQKIWSRMRSSESLVHLPCGIWLGSTPTQDSIVPKELVYFGNPDPKHVSRNVFLVDFYDCIPCGGTCPSRHASYYMVVSMIFLSFHPKTWGNCQIWFDGCIFFLNMVVKNHQHGIWIWWLVIFKKIQLHNHWIFSPSTWKKNIQLHTRFFHVGSTFPPKIQVRRQGYIYTHIPIHLVDFIYTCNI